MQAYFEADFVHGEWGFYMPYIGNYDCIYDGALKGCLTTADKLSEGSRIKYLKAPTIKVNGL